MITTLYEQGKSEGYDHFNDLVYALKMLHWTYGAGDIQWIVADSDDYMGDGVVMAGTLQAKRTSCEAAKYRWTVSRLALSDKWNVRLHSRSRRIDPIREVL